MLKPNDLRAGLGGQIASVEFPLGPLSEILRDINVATNLSL